VRIGVVDEHGEAAVAHLIVGVGVLMVAGIGRAVDGRQPAGGVVGIVDARAVGVVQARPPGARVVGVLG
jgi:hypothetical protein